MQNNLEPIRPVNTDMGRSNSMRKPFRSEIPVSTRQQSTTRAARPRHAARTGIRLAVVAIVAGFSTTASASDTNLVLIPDWTGILPLLLLLFVLLMFPANELLFKPIFRVLDERDKRTNGTRRRAGKILLDAEKTLADYELAIREVREAAERDRKSDIAGARTQSASVTAAAREQAHTQAERASRELAEALEESRVTMREQAQSIAAEAAGSVLGRPL
jgi:F-type H+-transporting ATPase subunit b